MSLEDLKKVLGDLTEEEKQIVLVHLNTDPETNPPVKKRKQSRRKQNRKHDHPQPSKKEPEPIVSELGAPRKPKRRQKAQRKPKVQGSPCVQTAIQLGSKINKFDLSEDKNKHKDDTKIDKQLWQGKSRNHQPRQEQFVTAVCNKCDYEFDDVPVKRCYYDDEGLVFVCDECANRRQDGRTN